jgi:hypothetical protein
MHKIQRRGGGVAMMWVSFAIDGNKQKGKCLVVEHSALRWAKANNAFPKGSPWWVPMVDGMIVTLSSQLWWLYNKGD